MEIVHRHRDEKILLVSDAHLVPRDTVRMASFITMLEKETTDCSTFYILGDLFEFWYEYRTVAYCDYFPVFFLLHDLVRRGIKVVYLTGNHDFAAGTFFQNHVKISVFHDPITIMIDDLIVLLAHGDLINTHDYGYRVLRRLTRMRVIRRLFSLLHPDLGWRLAMRVAGTSRNLHQVKREVREDVYANYLTARRAEGYDVVIHGHFHQAYQRTLTSPQGAITVLNTGDWLHSFSWITYENREFCVRSVQG